MQSTILGGLRGVRCILEYAYSAQADLGSIDLPMDALYPRAERPEVLQPASQEHDGAAAGWRRNGGGAGGGTGRGARRQVYF